MKQTILISLSIGILVCACNSRHSSTAETEMVESTVSQQALHSPTDLTAENVFTAGCEGPAVDINGNIYAVNFQREGTIGSVTPEGEARLFIELPEGSTGNGIRFNQYGDMFIADYTGHNILRIKAGTNKIETFAHNPKMNQPNDIAISNSGILFASDPDWENKRGQLWRIDTTGVTTLLESNMGTTNGIEVSPNDEYLYVNESEQRCIWRYSLDAKGNISNKQLFYQFNDFGLDGMRCDIEGNLYIARYDAGLVAILSPDGVLLYAIYLNGQKPTNVTFGGPDNKTVYVTMQDRGNIEYFINDIAGAR